MAAGPRFSIPWYDDDDQRNKRSDNYRSIERVINFLPNAPYLYIYVQVF